MVVLLTLGIVFPTTEYRGTKAILITTRTVMGGRNNFLGIAYIIVGGMCIVLGAIFTATHLIKPRSVTNPQNMPLETISPDLLLPLRYICVLSNIHHRKLGDHTYLSWNNAPAPKAGGPSTAMASGRELRPGEA